MSGYHDNPHSLQDGRFPDEEQDFNAGFGGDEKDAMASTGRSSRGRNPYRRKLMALICVCLFVVVVVVAAVAVGIGLSNRRRNKDDGDGGNGGTTGTSAGQTTPSPTPAGGTQPLDWFQHGSVMYGSQPGDLFGRSTCVSGDGAIVAAGAPGRPGKRGYIRIYVHDSVDWLPIGNDILGNDNSVSDFGWSCALSDDGLTLAVGDWIGSSDEKGVIRVFSFNGRQWRQRGQDVEGEIAFDHAGWDVALSGDGATLAVGVPGNDDGGDRAGYVRVYQYEDNNAGQWTQLGQDVQGAASVDEAGKSVALTNNGRGLLVGARRNDGTAGQDTGHVRLYTYTGVRWEQRGNDIQGVGAGDEAGWAADMSGNGDIVAVGAYLHNSRAGQVRVFRYGNNNDWVQMGADLDGESGNDQLGYSVSLSEDGLTVAAGTHFDGTNSGGARLGSVSVYRFEASGSANDGTGVWRKLGSTVFGNAAGDLAGTSVALSSDGRSFVIGASNESNGGPGYATVYEYRQGRAGETPGRGGGTNNNNNNGQMTPVTSTTITPAPTPITPAPTPVPVFSWSTYGERLTGSMQGDLFGQSVCLSSDGTTMAIGANLLTSGGYVRVLRLTSGAWAVLGNDISVDLTTDFGWSCALSNNGERLAVGDGLFNGVAAESGGVWTYDFDPGSNSWTAFGTVLQGDATSDHAGWSVAFDADGQRLAVGVPGSDQNGDKRNAGSVKVYERQGQAWSQLGESIQGEAAFDEAGISVSLSNGGSTIAVGARLNDDRGINAGQLRVFEYDGTAWTQVGGDINGERASNEFGWSSMLSGDGNRVIVGARLNADVGFRAGHARVYELTGGNWIQLGTDIDGDSANSDFGFSVAISKDGTTVAAGAPRNTNSNGAQAGSAHVYRYNGQNWYQVGEVLLGDGAGDLFGGQVSLNIDGTVLAVGANQEPNGQNPGYVSTFRLQVEQ